MFLFIYGGSRDWILSPLKKLQNKGQIDTTAWSCVFAVCSLAAQKSYLNTFETALKMLSTTPATKCSLSNPQKNIYWIQSTHCKSYIWIRIRLKTCPMLQFALHHLLFPSLWLTLLLLCSSIYIVVLKLVNKSTGSGAFSGNKTSPSQCVRWEKFLT